MSDKEYRKSSILILFFIHSKHKPIILLFVYSQKPNRRSIFSIYCSEKTNEEQEDFDVTQGHIHIHVV